MQNIIRNFGVGTWTKNTGTFQEQVAFEACLVEMKIKGIKSGRMTNDDVSDTKVCLDALSIVIYLLSFLSFSQ